MAPKKKDASEYIKETEAWCVEHGTKYGFPQERADHAGNNLARKLRLNEEKFSVADKSALDKMRESLVLDVGLSPFQNNYYILGWLGLVKYKTISRT